MKKRKIIKEKIVEQKLDANGYNTVELEKDGIKKTFLVCFLVAQTFVPNPNKFKYVRHKNGIITDDAATNLEWATTPEFNPQCLAL